MALHHLKTAAPLTPELAKIAEQLRLDGEKTVASQPWATAVHYGGAAAALAVVGYTPRQSGDAEFIHALTLLERLEQGDESEVNDILAVAKGEALTAWTMRRDHARAMRARLAAACAPQAEGIAA